MRSIFILLFLTLLYYGCSDIESINGLQTESHDIKVAIPLVNTTFTVGDFTGEDAGGNNVSIEIDENQKITLIYKGDVVRQSFEDIFPVVDSFSFPIPDTVFSIPSPFAADQKVNKATFANTNMGFRFLSSYTEDVDVTIEIDQLFDEGKPFEYHLTIPGGISIFDSPKINLQGMNLNVIDNDITVRYVARLPSGERIKFTGMGITFWNIDFDYIEGYFGMDVFDIQGDFIPVGILDTWKSGGVVFDDPSISIYTENAFGFPVRSIFKKMLVENTLGEIFDLQSDIINTNIDFAYPALNEVGEAKITKFFFDKTNSNIVDLFSKKVKRVIYDIDALSNPDGDESIIGFVHKDGYFLVNVDVRIPLLGDVNELVLSDTIDLDLSSFDEDLDSVIFKIITANDFPMDIDIQGIMLDQEGSVLDSIFDGALEMNAAQIDAAGRSLGGEDMITYSEYDRKDIERIKKTKRMVITVRLNSESSQPLWIYNDYGIDLRIGAIVTKSIK